MMSFFLFLSLWSGKLGAFHYFYKQKLLSCAQKAFGENSFGALYRKHQTHSFSRSRYDSFFYSLYNKWVTYLYKLTAKKQKEKERKKKSNKNNKTILLTKEAASRQVRSKSRGMSKGFNNVYKCQKRRMIVYLHMGGGPSSPTHSVADSTSWRRTGSRQRSS